MGARTPKPASLTTVLPRGAPQATSSASQLHTRVPSDTTPWKCPWQGLPRCTLPACSSPPAAWFKSLRLSLAITHPFSWSMAGTEGQHSVSWDGTLVLGCHRGLEVNGQGECSEEQIVPDLPARLSSAQPKQAPKTGKTAWARDSAFWTTQDKPTAVITHQPCRAACTKARQLQSPALLQEHHGPGHPKVGSTLTQTLAALPVPTRQQQGRALTWERLCARVWPANASCSLCRVGQVTSS